MISVKIGKRGGASMSECGEDGLYLIAGGANRYNETFKDFWKIKIEKSENGKLVAGKMKIGDFDNWFARTGHCSVSTSTGDVYIFGGQHFTHQRHNNEFFYFKGNNDNLIKIDDSKGDLPPKRNSHAMAYHTDSNSIYLFGGADEEGPKKDFYRYKIDEKTWEKLEVPEDVKDLEMHTMESWGKNKLLIIGGRSSEGVSKHIYKYDVKQNKWDLGFKKLPVPLCAHSSLMVGDFLYVVGGLAEQLLSDFIFKIDLVEKSSTRATFSDFEDKGVVQSKEMAGIMATNLAFCKKYNCFVLFGGSTLADELDRILIIEMDKLEEKLE